MRCHYSHHEITECENSNVECLLAVLAYFFISPKVCREEMST